MSCFFSGNSVVSFVCKHALVSGRMHSPIGRNVLFICQRYQLKQNDFTVASRLKTMLAAVNRLCYDHMSAAISLDHLNLLLELLMLRDNIFSLQFVDSGLDKLCIQDIINFICTM